MNSQDLINTLISYQYTKTEFFPKKLGVSDLTARKYLEYLTTTDCFKRQQSWEPAFMGTRPWCKYWLNHRRCKLGRELQESRELPSTRPYMYRWNTGLCFFTMIRILNQWKEFLGSGYNDERIQLCLKSIWANQDEDNDPWCGCSYTWKRDHENGNAALGPLYQFHAIYSNVRNE